MKRFANTLLAAGFGLSLFAALPANATSFDLTATLATAPTNAVIDVPAGIYPGPLTITKPVTLVAKAGAVIEGNGQGTVVRIEAPDVTLRGFIIRNSGQYLSSEDSGILVKAARACIESNRLDHVLFGIYFKQSPDSRIIGNQVRGYDLALPVRGDGIRLWYSHHCVIQGNDVQNSRDNIIWFSKDDVIAQNHFTHDRYGLHLMYDDGLTITNNWLADNFVGAFLMYSWHIAFEGNVCVNNRGVSGYGLGIKNINDIRAANNRILDNAVGIWMTSSPSALTATNLFQLNILAYNDTGLMLDPSDQGNTFTENTFMNNSQQVAKDSDGTLERDDFSLHGRGNYWSDYKGYPGSNPAIGALPYRVQNLFDSLADQYPNLQLFRFSPAQEAIDLAAEAFPLIQPEVVLTDPHPLMEPPLISAAALPVQNSAGLPAMSLALLAGIGMVVGTAEMEVRRRHKKSKPTPTVPSEAATSLVNVNGLSKSFGRRQVLRGLNFSVPRGRAIAFWGGNGAGKSTTIKCILGLLNFQGSIQVGGLDVIRQGKRARRLLGYVPQELSFYPDWTVLRTMNFCARIKRVSSDEEQRLLAEVGLEAQTAKKVSELSGGMKQRLGLAVALLGNPAVLLLDEFTSNLDAEAREALIALLAQQRSKGLTVLFATHRMDEVESLADEVLFMEQGQILRRCTVTEMKQKVASGRTLKVTLPASELEQAAALFGTAGLKYRRSGENLLVEVNGHGAMTPLTLLWERRIQIREMDLIHRSETANGNHPVFNS
ncbi:MAG TPA: nitrous oxide reductase family maturation protein NosD [Verrucomicrobiae bacterium]|nr:nitrous oxide reductase family maturation protein NosD [Verrucomicrobiae bacterium]